MSESAYVRHRDTTSEHGQKRDLSYPPLPESLPVAVYDNHTHLEISDGDTPLTYLEHVERAAEVGVIGVVQVGGDVETSKWSATIAAGEPRMLAAVAIHPNEAPNYDEAGTLDDALAVIDELASWPRTRAIGETGLDYFRTGPEGQPAQHRSFEAHIEIAKKHSIAKRVYRECSFAELLVILCRQMWHIGHFKS